MKKSVLKKFRNLRLPVDIEEHSERVCNLALAIANEVIKCKASIEIDIEALETAALFHDVGKPKIRNEVLHKPGPLTSKEKHEMNQHVKFSGHYAYKYRLGDKVTRIILHHHERCDGSGYPFGVKVEDIETKILMIADVFDALVSDRPYRKGLSIVDALEIITLEKSKYDSYVLECFFNMANEAFNHEYIA